MDLIDSRLRAVIGNGKHHRLGLRNKIVSEQKKTQKQINKWEEEKRISVVAFSIPSWLYLIFIYSNGVYRFKCLSIIAG